MSVLYDDIELNILTFNNDFADSSDFLLREIMINNTKGFIAVMDGLIDSLQLSHMVIEPILENDASFDSANEHFDVLKSSVIRSAEMNEIRTFDECYYFLASGFAIFMLDGCCRALALGAQGWSSRETGESTNEANVKGAKECFVESLNDNKALLRKRLKTSHLKQKQIKLGTDIPTAVAICYLDDRAEPSLVEDIENRLKSAELKTVLDYGELHPFLDTDVKSFFTAVGDTERPDVLASKLLEGRVAVMVDGTPFVMYTPCLFTDSFSSLDDYDNPPIFSSFIRFLKYFSFIISVFLPGIYVALGTFHQEAIPTNLLYVIATSEATTPFSLMLEALMIHLLYEIMREAGLRLPQNIGHAVSIIGAIVIGDATVSAGIIGAPMLIVVAVTAISSYVIYPLYESVAVLRLTFIVLGGILGLYGIMLGAGMLFCNICAINPYGVAFSSPLSPLTIKSLKDTLIREGWKSLSRRDISINKLEGANVENKS